MGASGRKAYSSVIITAGGQLTSAKDTGRPPDSERYRDGPETWEDPA